MTHIPCDVLSSSSFSSSLVPPVESSLPGPQFDWECPDFSINCPCPSITATATVEKIGCQDDPFCLVDVDCLESSSCYLYSMSLAIGLPACDGTVVSVDTADSVTGGPIVDSGTISLVNDQLAPGNSYYYGTDSSGTKGFWQLWSSLTILTSSVWTIAANKIFSVNGPGYLQLNAGVKTYGLQWWMYRVLSIATSTLVDYDPGPTYRPVYVFNTAAPFSISGWVPQLDGGAGQLMWLHNPTSNTITLLHEDAASMAANRFALPLQINMALDINESVLCWYDPSVSRWKVIPSGSDIVNITFPINATWTINTGQIWAINGPGFLRLNAGVKYYNLQWWMYQTLDIAAIENDYNPGPDADGLYKPVYRLNPAADSVISGWVPQLDGGAGNLMLLFNVSGHSVFITHEDTNSAAANRFHLHNDVEIELTPNDGVLCWYDPVTTRWRVMSLCCGGSSPPFADNTAIVMNNADNTKLFKIDASNIATGTTRTWIVPNASDTFVGLATAQTLQNKTLDSSCVISSTASLPSGTAVANTVSTFPQWIKVTKTFSDFSAAANTNTINIYSLPAGGVLHSVKAKHSVAFSGGGITTYRLDNVQDAAGNSFAFGVPLNTPVVAMGGHQFMFTTPGTQPSCSQTAATNITAQVSSSGGLLNTATQGSIDIWLLVSVAT